MKIRLVKIRAEHFLILTLFILAAGLRAWPEIKVGYWPIGYDSFNAYLPDIIKFDGNFFRWFWSSNLLYFLIWPFYRFLGVESALLIKITGCALYGAFVVTFYVFCRRYLKWPAKTAFFAGALLAIQLPALRLAWDLFRNLLALIFLFGAIYFLGNNAKVKNRMFFGLFSFLVALSNQLVAALWFVAVICWVFRQIIRKKSQEVFAVILAVLPALLFFVLTIELPITNNFGGHVFYLSEPERVLNYFEIYKNKASYQEWAATVWGLFKLCYLYILPLVLYGFYLLRKNFLLTVLTLWLLLGTFSSLISGGYGLFVWSRWLFMLAVPLTIYATAGLFDLGQRLVGLKIFQPKLIRKFLLPAFGGIILVSYWGFFVWKNWPFLVAPAQQAKAPLLDTRINDQFPPSMLVNAVGFENMADVLKCIDFINNNTPESSVIFIDNRYRGISLVRMDYKDRYIYTYPWSKTVRNKLILRIRKENKGPIYTIWSSRQKISGFTRVFTSGEAAVYRD